MYIGKVFPNYNAQETHLKSIVCRFWSSDPVIPVGVRNWLFNRQVTPGDYATTADVWPTCIETDREASMCSSLFFSFFKYLIYLFLERGEGRERERERNISVQEIHRSCMPPSGTWPATQACTLTGNWTSDLLLCRKVPNWATLARAIFVGASWKR